MDDRGARDGCHGVAVLERDEAAAVPPLPILDVAAAHGRGLVLNHRDDRGGLEVAGRRFNGKNLARVLA